MLIEHFKHSKQTVLAFCHDIPSHILGMLYMFLLENFHKNTSQHD